MRLLTNIMKIDMGQLWSDISERPNAHCFRDTAQCKALQRITYEIEALSVILS